MSRTAFVLSGGGAKGASQVGALRALIDQGRSPDVIYGTSVGGLNAAGYAFNGMNGLEQIWREIRKESDIIKGGGIIRGIKAMLSRRKGLYSTKPLEKLIHKHVDGKPSIEAVVAAVNMEDGSIKYARSTPEEPDVNRFRRFVLGSASMPIIMDLVGDWADGGVREVTPLNVAINDGADELVVLLANPFNTNPAMTGRVGKLLDIARRTLEIMNHEVFLNDIHTCAKYNEHGVGKRIKLSVYAPDELLIDTLEFDPAKIETAIGQGKDAVRDGPKLRSGFENHGDLSDCTPEL